MKFFNHFFLIFLIIFSFVDIKAEENTLNIGLLKWGSVNWEMDIIEHNKLNKKNNVIIKKNFFLLKMLLQLLCKEKPSM